MRVLPRDSGSRHFSYVWLCSAARLSAATSQTIITGRPRDTAVCHIHTPITSLTFAHAHSRTHTHDLYDPCTFATSATCTIFSQRNTEAPLHVSMTLFMNPNTARVDEQTLFSSARTFEPKMRLWYNYYYWYFCRIIITGMSWFPLLSLVLFCCSLVSVLPLVLLLLLSLIIAIINNMI